MIGASGLFYRADRARSAAPLSAERNFLLPRQAQPGARAGNQFGVFRESMQAAAVCRQCRQGQTLRGSFSEFQQGHWKCVSH